MSSQTFERMPGRNFVSDTLFYAKRMRFFDKTDWSVYFAWVGLMVGLLVFVCGFIGVGWWKGVQYPAYVWNIPIGTFIFILAIAFDTIGHRTAYKAALQRGENLVHHITIFAGITSVVLLCLAYNFPDFCRIPAYCFIALSIFYSAIDEWMHWGRYMEGDSDRIEMWSHFFIFVGHTIMVIAWSYWFEKGYPGVAETLKYLS